MFWRRNDPIKCSKFIKRKAFIRALNSINGFYLNLYMITLEDGLMNYIFYRSAKSLYYIKKVGYYYINNKKGFSRIKFNNKILKSIFYNLKLLFEYSKNNKYEKDMANAFFYKFLMPINNKILKLMIRNDCSFYNNIIELYLNSEFISIENKKKLKKIKC